MKAVVASALVMFMAIPFASLRAQDGLSAGLRVGTTGFGLEASTSIHQKLNVRLGGSFYSQSINGDMEEGDVGIDYNADMSMISIPALVDYYPANRGFRLTGGFHYHNLSISGGAVPNENYTMNNKTFTPQKLGSLSANIDYGSAISPYLGLGFGNSLAPGSKIKLSLDLGAMYISSTKVSMDGTGMIAPTADQAPDFEEGLSEFKFFPVFNLGLSYRITDKSL